VLHLCMVGHNPGMENIVNLLLGERGVAGFVTCGVAMLELDITSWSSTQPGCATLQRFLTPRSLWGAAE
jgi:phosphohistidine phosphatase SixA